MTPPIRPEPAEDWLAQYRYMGPTPRRRRRPEMLSDVKPNTGVSGKILDAANVIDSMVRGMGRQLVEHPVRAIADNVPVLGAVLAGKDIGQGLAKGEMSRKQAAITAALAALPFGGVARKAEGAAARELEEAAARRVLNDKLTPKMLEMRDAPEAVAARMDDAWRKLEEPMPQAIPQPHGIIDRSKIVPDAGPVAAPLPAREAYGPRAAAGHHAGMDAPENTDLIVAQVQKGLTQPASRLFYPSVPAVLDAIGNAGGDPNLFHHASTAAAIRASVPAEIVGGSAMQWALKNGIVSADELAEIAARGGKGVWDEPAKRIRTAFAQAHPDAQGLQLMPVHVQTLQKRLAGAGSDNYKIPTYGDQKLGNVPGFVLDTHESKGGTLASPFHRWFAEQGGFAAPEYGEQEQLYRRLAANLGLSDRTFQAARWFGGHNITGLLTPPTSDYAQIFEDVLVNNAQHRGVDPRRLLEDVARGSTAFYVPRR